MARHVVARAADLPEGASRVFSVRGREIAVFNLSGEFFALINRCPHEGAPLAAGLRVGLSDSDRPGHYAHSRPGELLRCPWHGWEFDLRTGKQLVDEKMKLRGYAIATGKSENLEAFPIEADEETLYVIL